MSITVKELKLLERENQTYSQRILKRILASLPMVVTGLHLLEYNLVVNAGKNQSTNVYNIFLGVFFTIFAVWFVLSFFSIEIYEKLTYKSTLYTVIFLALLIYDYNTLKTGNLTMPYFPWLDRIFNSIINDRAKLWDCTYHSLELLFTGYFIGVAAGLLSGILAGWSKRVSYWITPVTKVLGAIPTTTYMPIVMIVCASLFSGAAFIIALGVWFPVTVTSMIGVSSVRKHFYEVARTLGTNKRGILFRVVIPAAMPNIFAGLTQGMSIACLTLVTAEMMGVESGLGWYVNWQKGWAEFSKMYGAIIIICLVFVFTNGVLGLIKKRVLRWQKEGV